VAEAWELDRSVLLRDMHDVYRRSLSGSTVVPANGIVLRPCSRDLRN